jgi:predicted house-cleaning noncanonical NTP pyrophosphatase (MazG superfamily)
MPVKKYDKLVRDQVPGMLRGSGHKVVTRTIYGKELLKALRTRFGEELVEYDAAVDDEKAAASLVEMAELIGAMAKQRGMSESKFQAAREAKVAQQGAFDLGIFVVTID